MSKATIFIEGFAVGFICCGLIFLLTAVLSACASPTRSIPLREQQLIAVDAQIDKLNAQRLSILKAIAEEKNK